MSAKLIVHKYETEVNFKSLFITIDDADEDTPNVKFSSWADGEIMDKRKETDKSARLIVKIVTGNDCDLLNLNSFAKSNNDSSVQVRTLMTLAESDHKLANGVFNIDKPNCNDKVQQNHSTDLEGIIKIDMSLNQKHNNENGENINGTDKFNDIPNSLENSLERVKANNARIMENIQMLNRTINYTKKKEILDIVCRKSMRSYPCVTCGKCFVYETGLRRHNSMRHTMMEIEPRWQSVWTCIECFQVWPRQDVATEHSSQCSRTNKKDCVREIKTSSLLQCEFCEKVFTSIPRLLRHLKIHTTASNYECNACTLVFTSYKTAEQHWPICPWLKTNYTFALPKMLLCNACDRKFKSYEQLYNHRYKVGHFVPKIRCNQNTEKDLEILVYQCEICAQWFTSIPTLEAHRNQCHPRNNIQTQINTIYNGFENDCLHQDY